MAGNEPTLNSQPVIQREISSGDQFSLRGFLEVLRRRRTSALLAFVVVVALGLALLLTTRPLYQARVRLLVENRPATTTAANNADPYSNLFLTAADHSVETQVEVLQSANLINRVADRIDVSPETIRVEVRQLGKTDLAEVSVTSRSRQAAQDFATALPAAYLQEVRSGRLSEVTNALSLARRRLAQKTAQLTNAERALENYRSRVGVVDPQAERTQDISAAAAARAAAGQAAAEASSALARLRALETSRRRTPGFLSTPVTTTNPEVAILRDRLASLREERARLLFLYKPGSDEVQRVDVGITALNRRLASTPGIITTTTRAPNPAAAELDAQVAEARAQYHAAEASWARSAGTASRLQDSLARYNTIEMRQAQLQRAVDQARNSVELLSRSVEEMSLRETAAQASRAPLRVVGVLPAEKIAPRVMRHLLVTLLLGLLLACAVAVLQESLDDRIRNEEEARTLLEVPVFSYLPRAGEHFALIGAASDPQILESYRMLRANVQLALEKCCDHSLLVTSTLAGEGKSQTAANLAMSLAMENWRVILVDANLRQPALHHLLHLPSRPGLADVLAEKSTLEDALLQSDQPHLQLMPAGNLNPNSADLLNSPVMKDVILKLNGKADFVIIDSTPASLADAQVLASKVDGVLYVLEMGRVPRGSLRRSIEQLQRADANVLGVTLTQAASPDAIPAYDTNFSSYDDGTGGGYRSGTKTSGLKAKKQTDPLIEDPFARRSTVGIGSLGREERPLVKKLVIAAAVTILAIFAFQAMRSRNASDFTDGVVAATSEGQSTLIRIADVKGTVEFWPAADENANAWQSARASDTLPAAFSLRTASDSAALLRLGNSGVLRVGGNSELKLRRVANNEYSVLVREGKVWTLVRSDAQNSVHVRTPAALFSSNDGVFSVASNFDGTLTMASTHEGSATVRLGDRGAELPAGHAIRVTRDQAESLDVTTQQPAAQNMWELLSKQEKWLHPEGELRLSR